MAVELIDDGKLWDEFVDASPSATIFHRWKLLGILEKYTGYALRPYGVYKGGELVSVLPLFMKKRNAMTFIYSPPQWTLSYIQYVGFATCPRYEELKPGGKEAYWDYVVGEVDREIKRLSPSYVSLTLPPEYTDLRPFYWTDYEALIYYTYMIDLERPLDAIWAGFEKECRKNINEASKLDLSLRCSGDVDRLFEIMGERLNHKGKTFFNTQSADYIRELLEAFPENFKMYFLYSGEEVVGVKLNVGYKGRYTSWMGNAAMRREVSTNEYVVWELLKQAKADGYRTYEIQGADDRQSNQFKSKFNPSLMPYYYIIKKDIRYKTASYGSEVLFKMLRR